MTDDRLAWRGTGHPIEYIEWRLGTPMTWDHVLFRHVTDEQRRWILETRDMVVGESAIRTLARHMADELDVPMPTLRLHQRRKRMNGRYVPSSIAQTNNRYGIIRLGRYATVDIIAHEMAHHYVSWTQPAGTAAHGRVWAWAFGDMIEVVRHDFAWEPWRGERIATIRTSQ